MITLRRGWSVMTTISAYRTIALTAMLTGLAAFATDHAAAQDVPVINGALWQITGDNPDVSPYTIVDDHPTNVCDFTIYEDDFGTWHAIACVRQTSAPGERVFHHWTSDELTDTDWTPQGIYDWPRSTLFDRVQGLQAPHAFKHGDQYFAFYNTGNEARAMVSNDGGGDNWEPFTTASGDLKLFEMGRDVNIFYDDIRDRWQATYTGGAPGIDGHAMVARTATDLAGPWSDPPFAVKAEGNPESPFLHKHGDHYYLLQQLKVFVSDDPTHFEDNQLTRLSTKAGRKEFKFAPEIISVGDKQYISGYGGGLHIAELTWVPKDRPTVAAFDFEDGTTQGTAGGGAAVSAVTTAVELKGVETLGGSGRMFGARDFTAPDEPGAVAGDDYFSFTVTVPDEKELDLSLLSLYVDRRNGGATDWFIRTSLDGFSENIASGAVDSATHYIELDHLPAAEGELELRIYGYGQTTASARFFIDDVQLDGSVIPEPTTAALLAPPLMMLITRRSRR